jgi:hypothetical protein
MADEIKRKVGKLSLDERDYIEENVDKMSIVEIARALNRTERPIVRYIEDHNLISVGHTKDMADDIRLKDRLHNREYWLMVRDQELVNEQEIAFFEDWWIKLFKQFGDDVVASEEGQIKELIISHIHQHRILVDEKMFQMQLEEAQNRFKLEMAKPDDIRDDNQMAMLQADLRDARGGLHELRKLYKDLSAQSKELLKALRATREQRIKHIKDAETSFAGWLYDLEDERRRLAWSNEAEIMRLAKDKARKELGEYHTYIDGTIDKPILTPESVLEDEND